MGRIVRYVAHDPIGNCEGYVTEFDPEILKRASDGGIIFIAIDDEGNRSVVGVDEVKEPVNDDKPFIVVQPVYVDDRFKAVVDVFDALAASVPAVASNADVQPVSSKARSAMSFAQALEALRKLAHPDSEEGGAQ